MDNDEIADLLADAVRDLKRIGYACGAVAVCVVFGLGVVTGVML